MSAGVPASALWLRATSQLRRRWRSWLGLALLIGLASGEVLGAAAGARRTSSAYDRLASSADAFTVVLDIRCQDEESPSCADEQPAASQQVLALPEVADGVVVTTFLLPVLDDEGRSIQPQEESTGTTTGEVCVTGSGEVDVIGSADGRLGTELNRHRFVEGRAADPSRADEVVVSVATARRADVEVGEVLTIVPVDACDDIPTQEWPAPIEVTVVGLQLSPGEVQPEAGRYLQSVTVTPPLLQRITRETSGGGDTPLMMRLRPGVDVMELETAIEAKGLVAQPIILGDELAASVRRGHRQDAVSLWLLVGLGGLASLVVLGLALARQVSAAANEVPLLRAVGLTTGDLVLAGGIEGGAAGAVAGVVAVAVASTASIVTPIGRARSAEPSPGFDLDSGALVLGGITVLAIVALIVTGVSRLVAARSSSPGGPRVRQSVVVRAINRIGLPVPASIGAHLALSRGGGARPVPVRSGLIATAVGFAALTGSLTFGADLEHLLETPRLVGWNWDVAFFGALEADGSEAEDPRATVDAADALVRGALALPGVERAGYLTVFPPSEVPPLASIPDIRPMSFSSGPGSISPTLTSGRAPAGPEEVLVTSSVLAELDAEVGEDIEVQAAAIDDSGELTFEPRSMTVVGTGVLPLGDGGFDRAVSFTFAGQQRLAPDAVPHLVVVDLRPGSNRRDTLAALEERGLSGPLPAGDIDVTELVDLDVRQADNVPRLFGGLMAVLGLGVLMHLVLTGLRAGRRELATLRALGFTTRQVRSSAAWQASVATVVPYVVGAFVGVVVGRRVWLAYSDRLNVAPATVSAWRPIVGFFLALLALANLIGALAAWWALRHGSSVELRSE
jgi:hypothetical protein